ncbi:MAG: hypothetical protein J5594_01480 [Elusimicrobiaceae bacterium]|nr:hypothetical protein [Elusimicrobiaceae bacterium]
MIKFKRFIIPVLLVLAFCVSGFAQDQKPIISAGEIKEFVKKQYLRDVVFESKKIIYKYYGRKNFEEQEWIRVKNFLTWLDDNKDSLNIKFAGKNLSKLSEENKILYMGAFLGAEYVTRQMINKDFDLNINFSDSCYTSNCGYICISADDFIYAINGAMHEAAHMFPYVHNPSAKGRILDITGNLSEEITMFSQLKYGLPMKEESNNILLGTRATFIFADENFIKKHIEEILGGKELLGEYADIVYSATRYSYYNKDNLVNYKWRYTYYVDNVLRSAVFYKIQQKLPFDKPKLEENERAFLMTPVYRDTLNEIMPMFQPDSYNQWCSGYECYPYLYGKTSNECYEYIHQLFDAHKEEIATIFFKNLKKYADPNIPPVPKGYI